MDKIKVFLKDGSVREYPAGVTIQEVADGISRKLGAQALAGKWNGQVKDLCYALNEDGNLEILTFADEEGRQVYRHSSSHILAQAVQRLFLGTRLGIGPAIENGFIMILIWSSLLHRRIWSGLKKKLKRSLKKTKLLSGRRSARMRRSAFYGAW